MQEHTNTSSRPKLDMNTATEVIKGLKADAEKYFCHNVTHAVISAPVNFKGFQQQSLRDAGAAAGLEVLRVVKEPTAAGIAYDLDKTEEELAFIVYNLNLKTFDVTVETVDRGVFDVEAYASGEVGGEDFDQAVFDSIISSTDLKSRVEDAEKILSIRPTTRIQLSLTRAQRDEVYKKVFDKTVPLIEKVLKEAMMNKTDIGGIILTGNPQHIAKVQPLIEQYFDLKVYEGLRSNEAILRGLAQQAYVLSHETIDDNCYCSMEVNPTSLGIDIAGIFTKIIPRNTVYPTRKLITITITTNQPSIVLDILEGERLISSKNNHLGRLEIPVPVPVGSTDGDVTIVFEIDADGGLKVEAMDRERGVLGSVVIGDVVGRFSGEELDGMVLEAEGKYEEDLAAKQVMIELGASEAQFKVVERIFEDGGVVDEVGWLEWFGVWWRGY